MKKQSIMFGVVLSVMMLFASCASSASTLEVSGNAASGNATSGNLATPKYLFLFIGDGMGMPQRTLAEYYKNTQLGDTSPLAMHTLPIAADISTHSASTLITDSGAAATALSSGYKTYNGAIGVDNAEVSQQTILEALAAEGFATGLITSTRITHATPASFASHQPNRNWENEIAQDYLAARVDFLAGGGYRHFVGADSEFESKRDDAGLLADFQSAGYTTYISESDTQQFLQDDITVAEKVLGLFSYSHIPYVVDRDELFLEGKAYPTLDEMTAKGIEFLYNKGKDEGFFLMVEGGRIDHACHANDPMASIKETLELDNAIAEALAFYKAHPDETLILVTADHETGGLSLGGRLNDYNQDDSSTQEYALYLEKIVGNQSLEDVVGGMFQNLGQDRNAFIKYLEQDYGLGKLTEKELAILEPAMQDESDANPNNDSGIYYSKTCLAVSKIVALRANLNWSTELHTAVRIPLGALGAGAHTFSGYYDNHEVPVRMAQLVGITTPMVYAHTCEDDLVPLVDRFASQTRTSSFVTE